MTIFVITTTAGQGRQLSDLRDEFKARGFDYFSDPRANRYINEAYLELCDMHSWPFLEVTVEGTFPDEITDLRHLLSVKDTTQDTPLQGVDRRTLIDTSLDLSQTGNPRYFYFEGNILHTLPVSTNTLEVKYLKVPAELVGDTDYTIVPKRFNDLIIDLAVLRAYKDDDAWEQYASLQQVFDRRFAVFVGTFMNRNLFGPEYMEMYSDNEGYDW